MRTLNPKHSTHARMKTEQTLATQDSVAAVLAEALTLLTWKFRATNPRTMGA